MEFTLDQKVWLHALRSGQFLRTNGQLARDKTRHCCLGVAARVLLQRNEWSNDQEFLPEKLTERLQLYDNIGGFGVDWQVAGMDGLAELNDRLKWPLEKIADLIEAFPWLVFKNFKKPEEMTVEQKAQMVDFQLVKW